MSRRLKDNDEEDLVEEGADVAREAIVQHLRLAHELKERLTPQDLVVRTDGPSHRGRRRDATADYLFDLTRLSLHSYEEWLRIADKHLPSLLDLIAQPRFGGRPPEVTDSVRHKLSTAAAAGEQAAFRFVIKNPGASETRVAFTLPSLRHADGHVLNAPLTFQRLHHERHHHDDLILTRHENADFELLLQLPPHCERGDYRGEVCILCGSRVIAALDLHLEVRGGGAERRSVRWSEHGAAIDIAVRNPLAEAAGVSFTAFELRNPGGHALGAVASLARSGQNAAADPPLLQAHEHASLELRLKPPRNGAAKPGIYKGSTYVLVRDRTVFELALEVEVAK